MSRNEDERKARLAKALRDNLRRRKAQARGQADDLEAVDPPLSVTDAPSPPRR